MHEQPYQQLIRRLSWLPGPFDSSCLLRCSLAVTRACLQDHFLKILPEAEVEQLLGGRPDYVLDAIDNIDTKVALLAACHRRGIPVLSSAGAGGGF